MSIRILLVDDHRMMRDGLRAILEREEDIRVVRPPPHGRSAVQMTAELLPEVVIMDVGMQHMNGIEATRRIKERSPDVDVVALSTHSDKRYVLNMIEAGASGYVLKEAASEDLLRAVRTVHGGEKYLSSAVTNVVLERCVDRASTSEATAYGVLGAREREVLQLLAEGMTSKEIASHLRVTLSTVETHRRNISRKLDLHSIAELTKFAVREGLTSA